MTTAPECRCEWGWAWCRVHHGEPPVLPVSTSEEPERPWEVRLVEWLLRLLKRP